nr:MAG TPA: hypothetical protein [Caudoviricetes sp.]
MLLLIYQHNHQGTARLVHMFSVLLYALQWIPLIYQFRFEFLLLILLKNFYITTKRL